MKVTDVTDDIVRVELGPDEAVLINNALNEICNGGHIDARDFHARLGVDRSLAREVLTALHDAVEDMKQRRLTQGKPW
ncbi:hypothetical protein [Actinomadura sp. 7K507]|uniref:hypothetical protein n=1 Tax=Actinomadura sp. 7K507 TaxID=2530365 RepID=UPI00104344CD|nr:hypothetical protein [Actinomadura sp. 7K507]TDC80377.1 hypothetical protein E1285_34895 [Actinomadura sp. 7K507]